jgi:hypothetical protein
MVGVKMTGMDVDELYGLPPEDFVPERNALARELRAAGHRDEAREVAALRKPSVAARAVNRLAREHPRRLRELFEAGDALSGVQSEVLAGRAGGRALGEAAERERAAVSALVDAGRGLLAAEGLTASASVLERIGETLHAAALDDEAREPVQQGRLDRELRHIGLGMGAGEDVAAPPARSASPPKAPSEAKADKRAQAAAARRRAQAVKHAEAAEADARREAQRAARALSSAEGKRARAAEALDRTEEAVTAARAAAKAADQAHRTAERELRRLEP